MGRKTREKSGGGKAKVLEIGMNSKLPFIHWSTNAAELVSGRLSGVYLSQML